ncbi:Yfh7p [Saccharomyces cerevisiae x Saccharomyces kudriavzevii VIN7]|uniref:Yfh7p n=1 Tax=Saccharomyces cerevisiae x Saccharomyces kudriavzevii (strain VIN7) TaxID=1095631 RepID=H0GUB2_SACCK|nr:Yfh7p [Saccharomyces cerevisiae x Saccharomyces kudriavzevii VIN7]
MVDTHRLADNILQLLDNRIEHNYRVCVVLVGSPGSGKSTIAEDLCHIINQRYRSFLSEHPSIVKINNGLETSVDLVGSLKALLPNQVSDMNKNQGLFKDYVEDVNFQPVKYPDFTTNNRKCTTVVGRGGTANSIKIAEIDNAVDADQLTPESIDIAQIVPMDGFHLSRKCLNLFNDPKTAHERRGSPSTFDSNNFLQLCKILAKTSLCKSPSYDKSCLTSSVFEKLSKTFSRAIPDIFIPGFNHALRDPTPDQYCISRYTRIVIFEGLYLLYDQENWKQIYRTLADTGALLVYKIDIDYGVTEERIARRHLQSGLVSTLSEGREKFRSNDMLNGKDIDKHLINFDNIVHIRND